jgi:hypothetical protein
MKKSLFMVLSLSAKIQVARATPTIYPMELSKIH